jgi:thioredoxin-like negative regulator of GroEL
MNLKTMKYLSVFALCFFIATSSFAIEPKPNQSSTESSFKKIGEFEFRTLVYDYTSSNDSIKHFNTQSQIIIFEAAWCSQCRKSLPIYEALAAEYKSKLTFYRINYDEEKQLAETLGVRQLPTVMFFPVKGKPKFMVGYVPKEEFVAVMDQIHLMEMK